MSTTSYDNYIDQLIQQRLDEALADISAREQVSQATLQNQRAAAEAAGQEAMRGAYGDYVKNINPYGVASELEAALGLHKSGKSETSRINYYNVYQNALSGIRAGANAALSGINDQEAALALEFGSDRTKEKASAYNSLLEEYVRRQQAQYKQAQDERNYNFKLEQAAQDQANWEKQFALKVSSASSSSGSSSKTSAKTATLTNAQVQEIYDQISVLKWNGDTNGAAQAQINALLAVAYQNCSAEQYRKLVQLAG